VIELLFGPFIYGLILMPLLMSWATSAYYWG
jgi:hypothetical protein